MNGPHAERLDRDGFVLVCGLAGSAELDALKAFFAEADMDRAARGGETFGARNLLRLDPIQRFAASPRLAEILAPLLGEGFQAVRSLFFDKTESANWPVLWHQDLSLAIRRKAELAGWTNWSTKRGVPHVQPPSEILARMVTLRLHLDDCPAENGALRVIPGSHKTGHLDRDLIRDRTAAGARTIEARAGDGLLMRPLILHASSPAAAPSHRRVLHLEFAPPGLLPAPLEWAEAV
jgi:ectoine hydroxylase-related dioxygenase (phytanoyl-CoA dioxygenase family)